MTLAALAWGFILWLSQNTNMADMSSRTTMDMSSMLAPAFKPWTLVDFGYVFVMWAVMMIGMMVPSVSPTILLYARVGRQAEANGTPLAATGVFATGYLAAWLLFSLAATTSQWLLERAALLTPMLATSSGIIGGLVLIAAGVFQWTPMKNACLRHCQAPLVFIEHHGGFQRSARGSFSLGLLHGLYCVGCCWALMTLLFVGGVMNLIWIALLTSFVLLEKLGPPGRLISRTAGIGLIVWGSLLVANATR